MTHCSKEQEIKGVICYPCSVCGVIYPSEAELLNHIYAWEEIQDD